MIVRIMLVGLLAISASPVSAIPIEYRIDFEQTVFHPNFGPREFSGIFFVDDSILGPAFADQSFGVDLGALLLTDFTVNLGPGGTIYSYDSVYTAAIGLPPITQVLTLGSAGEVIDIQGGLTILGSLSQMILGREGREGTYADVQQIDRFSSVVVSRGTYTMERVTVPEPGTLALLTIGLAGIGLAKRRRNSRHELR